MRGKQKTQEFRVAELDAVVLFGNVQFSTQALWLLAGHGVSVALLTMNGRIHARLEAPAGKNSHRRWRQFTGAGKARFRRRLAGNIVAAKIESARRLVAEYSQEPPARKLSADLVRLATQARRGPNLDTLRGIEGTAARQYFGMFRRLLVGELPFTGRKARPPGDGVNALLSFGYTLLTNEICSLLEAVGLDPCIGVYHDRSYGRPSLACDVVEPLRAPVVDRLVLESVNAGLFTPGDLRPGDNGGVWLAEEAARRFFPLYERVMAAALARPYDGRRTTRLALRRLCERMAECFESGQPADFRAEIVPTFSLANA